MAKFVRRYHFDVREMVLLLGIFSTLSILMFTVGFMVGKTIDNRSKTLTLMDLVQDPAAQKLLAESTDIPSNLLMGKEKFPLRKDGRFEFSDKRQIASVKSGGAEHSNAEHGSGRTPQSEHLSAEQNVVGNKPLQQGSNTNIIEEPLLAKKHALAIENAATGAVPRGTEALFENLPHATPAEKEARKASLIGEGTKLKPAENEKAPQTAAHTAGAMVPAKAPLPAAVKAGAQAHAKEDSHKPVVEKPLETKKIKEAAHLTSPAAKEKDALVEVAKRDHENKGPKIALINKNPIAEKHESPILAKAHEKTEPNEPADDKKIPLELTPSVVTNRDGQYTVQIGAYQEKEEAKKRVEDLRKQYAQAYFIPTEIPGKGKWFRVGIGFFTDRRAAEQFGQSMVNREQVSGYLIRQVASIGKR